MTTIINNPPNSDGEGNGMGFLVGIILLIIVVVLFFSYGLPVLRNSASNSAPQINVPDKVDVNLHQGK